MLKSLFKVLLPPIIEIVSTFLIDSIKNMRKKKEVEPKVVKDESNN